MEFIKSESGSLESSDCLVSIEPSNDFSLEIVSTVDKQFHEIIIKDIESTIEKFKNQYGISELPLKVKVEDRGALSFALKARLMTALSRSLKR
jgi:citrate lyase subunit gamma (acyl carrier protein)